MELNYHKLISLGAVIAATGYITSGPLGFLVVKMVKPQPGWTSAAVFAANYHVVQDIPYYLGILLIGGMLMLAAGQYLNYKEDNEQTKFHLLLSLLWSSVFATLIFFNYTCQTTFIRHLALNYKPANDAVIATFSMANPASLSWSVEMWGYGILGIATWLMAGYYDKKNNAIRTMLVLNGVTSLLSVVITIVDINWILTTTGLVAYLLWNLLMIVLMIMIYRDSKKEPAS